MGGIPIDRTQRANVVEQVADEFARRDRLALVIAAEGTRSSKGEWKSGFYNIARAANVPIVPAWVCNTRRIVGFGPAIIPSANYGETLLEIARFMRGKLPEFERFKVLERQALQLIEENGT
jgi:1-acyl-sn-glycerol-3-phosphate acyltransferase